MSTARRAEAAGPLVVSAANPRYFAVASDPDDGRVVYLTGSHIWNNFHDGVGPGPARATSTSACPLSRGLGPARERPATASRSSTCPGSTRPTSTGSATASPPPARPASTSP